MVCWITVREPVPRHCAVKIPVWMECWRSDQLTSVTIVLPILPSAALVRTLFRPVLKMGHWHIAQLIAVATAAPYSSALQSGRISGTLFIYRSQLVTTLLDMSVTVGP